MARKTKPANVSQRSYSMILYPTCREDMQSFRLVRSQVKRLDRWAGCWHTILDDDGKEIVKGKGKKHLHIVLNFKYERSWHAVSKLLARDWCSDSGSRRLRPIGYDVKGEDLNGALAYLTHSNTPEKMQIPLSALFGSSSLVFKAQEEAQRWRSRFLPVTDFYRDLCAWASAQRSFITPANYLAWISSGPYIRFVRDSMAQRVISFRNFQLTHPFEDKEIDLSQIASVRDTFGILLPGEEFFA